MSTQLGWVVLTMKHASKQCLTYLIWKMLANHFQSRYPTELYKRMKLLYFVECMHTLVGDLQFRLHS